MPERDYEKILDYCKKEYFQKGLHVDAFPRHSEFHPEHFNDLGKKAKEPNFEKFDLVKMNRGNFSSDEFFLFITAPCFVPKNKNLVEMQNFPKGKWTYKGYIFSLSDSGDASYKTTPSNFPEKELSLLYREN